MKLPPLDQYTTKLNRLLLLLLAGLLLVAYWVCRNPPVTVREVRHKLGGEQVVERCVSCHATHPALKGHDPLLEACTPCHGGMGRGVTPNSAHGDHASGEEPYAMFDKTTISAGCVRCHPARSLPPETLAAKGWRLYLERGCGRCHTLRGTSSGTRGPDLSVIGDHLSIEALAGRVGQPQRNGHYSVMPTFPLQPADGRALAVFLKGQSMLHLRPSLYDPAAPEPSGAIERFRCTACHRFGAKDGMVGPDLDAAHRQRGAEWLTDFLTRVSALRPGARMPELTEASDVAAVVDELRKASEIDLPTQLPERYKLLCARCHGAAGDGKGPVAKNLTGWPRRFSDNQGYFRLASREKLVESVTYGISGTSMPPYGGVMSKEEAGAMVDFVLGTFAKTGSAETLADLEVPGKVTWGADGSAIYSRFCAHCHGPRGDRSTTVVHPGNPQPRNLRNRAYLDALSDQQLYRAIARGIPGTRMKAYQGAVPGSGVRTKAELYEPEIWGLVEHVRRLSHGGR